MVYGRAIVVALAVGLAAGPALAEHIVYFTNGSSMPVRGYVVEKDMIQLDMGQDAFIGFPMTMVERIEEAGKDVYLNPSTSRNQMFSIEPDQSGSQPVRALNRDRGPNAPAWEARGDPRTDGVEIHAEGLGGAEVARPHAGGVHAAKQKLEVVGNQGFTSGSGTGNVAGTRKVGGRYLLGSREAAPGSKGVRITGIQRKK